MQTSSKSSITLYGRKSLSPQNTPRSTEYTEVKINPGKTTKNIFAHLSSVNKNENALLNTKNIVHTGIAIIMVKSKPADITFATFSCLFSARYLVISRETVIGVPAQHAVNSNAKTESATWYSPIPSEPIVRDKNMRYINPKNFSLIENTVTIATVFINLLK